MMPAGHTVKEGSFIEGYIS